MFGFAIAIGFAALTAAYWATLNSRDTGKIKAHFVHEPGKIVELKLVSLPPLWFRRGSGPRIYRVVLELPEGGRILHRFAVRDFSPPERLV